jgi:hypothetical protein
MKKILVAVLLAVIFIAGFSQPVMAQTAGPESGYPVATPLPPAPCEDFYSMGTSPDICEAYYENHPDEYCASHPGDCSGADQPSQWSEQPQSEQVKAPSKLFTPETPLAIGITLLLLFALAISKQMR